MAGRLIVVVLAMLALLPMVPAEAHGELQAADPMPGEHLGTSPRQVLLQFAVGAVPHPRTRIEVITPSGADLAVGAAHATGLGVAQELSTATEGGKYRVLYAVVSADGHTMRGGYSFWINPPQGSTPHAATPTWWLGLIALLTTVAVAAAHVASRRSSSPVSD